MEQQNWYHSGTSGLTLPVRNKEFYPVEFKDKSRLEYYASLFNSLEINSSFYKVPMASTVAKWAMNVPDDFRFTFKLWKQITHNKGLAFSEEDVNHFMATIEAIGHKKGCLLVQFPPSLKVAFAERLAFLLSCIHDADPKRQWKIAVEFRDKSWYKEEIYDMLERHGACIVAHDMPASITPRLNSQLHFAYLRLHGPEGKYRGSYSDDFLFEFAEYISELREEGKEVFVYFNNTMGAAVHNLITLNEIIRERILGY